MTKSISLRAQLRGRQGYTPPRPCNRPTACLTRPSSSLTRSRMNRQFEHWAASAAACSLHTPSLSTSCCVNGNSGHKPVSLVARRPQFRLELGRKPDGFPDSQRQSDAALHSNLVWNRVAECLVHLGVIRLGCLVVLDRGFVGGALSFGQRGVSCKSVRSLFKARGEGDKTTRKNRGNKLDCV